MTVVVKYDPNGKAQYSSAKGIGSTEIERTRADKLDSLLKIELGNFHKIVENDGLSLRSKKESVEVYWELGNLLRNIFYNSGLIDDSEKHLYWLNVKLHMPKELLAKDRGPKRLHVEYCFRLAGLPKDKVLKMNWSEWVYLFDSPGIKHELRFDNWFEAKMEKVAEKFGRNDIRIFAQSINKILRNLETKDLSNEQINRVYDSIWMAKNYFIKKYSQDHDNKAVKTFILNWLENNRLKFGKIITSELSLDEYEKSLNSS